MPYVPGRRSRSRTASAAEARRAAQRAHLRTAALLAQVDLVSVSLEAHADELERLLDENADAPGSEDHDTPDDER